jgi:UDPglucose--hexose-1-phosphate uridylyltransferase
LPSQRLNLRRLIACRFSSFVSSNSPGYRMAGLVRARMKFEDSKLPHRRFNPLANEWVLVSPQRTQRPWQGQMESTEREKRPAHDPNCYLCAGNSRAGGAVNPSYEHTFVFTNDYAALMPGTEFETETDGLLRAETVDGECRVICFSPRHDLTLAEMDTEDIRLVVETWAEQTEELGQHYRWVQVFENKGAVMGCSNPHPHGQIWASNFLPTLVEKEDRAQRSYFEETGRSLLGDVVDQEITSGRRVVAINEDWVVLVPFWATWPFEYLVVPRRDVAQLPELNSQERDNLASILKIALGQYDALFDTSFPYTMGWHGAPFDDRSTAPWRLHAHYYPPLLRSATVKKFMVGYEMLAEPQRDLTPETAAEMLRKA